MDVVQQSVERIDALDGIDRVAEPLSAAVHRFTANDTVKNALSGTLLGHPVHPVLTDLPIGAWTMASALDLFGGARCSAAAQRLVAVGVLSSVPAAATGAADWSDSYGGDRRIGVAHGVLNLVANGFHAWSWNSRRRGRRGRGVALSLIGLGLTSAAGQLGGHLSFVRGIGVNRTFLEDRVTEWTPVAALDALTDREPVRVTVGSVPVVLVLVDGRVEALSATCTHAGGALDEGSVAVDERRGACIECPLHGSVFRLSDGSVERGPATVPQPAWQVRVDGRQVYVKSA